jgi:dTMP kinase
VSVTVTYEPGATAFGVRLRRILLESPDGPLTPRAEALLFAADRAQHVDAVIRPALDRGDVVITDRYVDSSLAYQGAGRALSMDDVRRLSRWATNGLTPDLTVLLDIDPELGLGRVQERSRNGHEPGGGGPDRLERESLEFHRRVRQAFRALADAAPDRYLVVDGSRHPEAVGAVVRTAVGKRLVARRVNRGYRERRPGADRRFVRRMRRRMAGRIGSAGREPARAGGASTDGPGPRRGATDSAAIDWPVPPDRASSDPTQSATAGEQTGNDQARPDWPAGNQASPDRRGADQPATDAEHRLADAPSSRGAATSAPEPGRPGQPRPGRDGSGEVADGSPAPAPRATT